MARRTRAEAAATREALLHAAEQEFLQRGVSRTSLEHIACRAGVTRGAIYWHFRDKTDLFAAMLERVRLPLANMADEFRQELGEEDPIGLLTKLCRIAFAQLEENETYRNVYTILFTRCEFAGEVNPVFEQQLAIDAETLQRVEVDIERARALGRVRGDVSPRVAALSLYALMHGIYVSWLRAPDSFSIRSDGEAMLEMFFRGLAP
ncbi:MAG: TetR family transcriptional regulator [Gammaproteobacteria bacterium]